jgi:VWFA-related protein
MPAVVSATFAAGSRRRVVTLACAGLVTGGALIAKPAAQQPSFRSSVDVIAVDVEVVDGEGNPIDMLGTDAFDVTIQGRRRQVVSADFVRYAWPRPSGSARQSAGVEPAAQPTSRGGRTMVIAVDVGSFEPGAERAPMEAAREFVQQVEPTDRVGLYAFPTATWIPPTTDRASLRIALDRLRGERQPIRSAYNLKPWEIVDISSQSTNPHSFRFLAGRPDASTDRATLAQFDPVLRVQARECPTDSDCPNRIYAEGIGLAMQLERQAQETFSGLETLIRGLARVEGRKSVVLVSAGVIVSDRPDGRPDAGDVARLIGQDAARANVVVYTVHVDSNALNPGSAARRGALSDDIGRDRAMYGTWLDRFSDAAGGDRLYVPVGGGTHAFDRVLRESSGYYLLGVDPGAEDRTGQPRELKVKVNRKGLTVRNRQWVVIPAKGNAPEQAVALKAQ